MSNSLDIDLGPGNLNVERAVAGDSWELVLRFYGNGINWSIRKVDTSGGIDHQTFLTLYETVAGSRL